MRCHAVPATIGDFPPPLLRLADLAGRVNGAAFLYQDELVSPTPAGQSLYPDLDWSGPVTFEAQFLAGIRSGRIADEGILADPQTHLFFAREYRRRVTSSGFCRLFGNTKYYRHHLSAGPRHNAQIWINIDDTSAILTLDKFLAEQGLAVDRSVLPVSFTAAADVLESVGLAFAVVDGDGGLHAHSPTMARVFSQAKILVLRAGRVEGTTRADTASLAAGLQRVLADGAPAALVPLRLDGRHSPAQIGVLPAGKAGKAGQALLVYSAAVAGDVFRRAVADAYGLSSGTAAVAVSVATGDIVKDVAAKRGSSVYTVQDHLAAARKRIVGSGQQHQLAHTLTVALSFLGGPDHH
jgi:hypothetical protein